MATMVTKFPYNASGRRAGRLVFTRSAALGFRSATFTASLRAGPFETTSLSNREVRTSPLGSMREQFVVSVSTHVSSSNHSSWRLSTEPSVLSRPQKHAADAALLAGSTVSPWKTSFRGDMNRNLQAPQNFLVEIAPKGRRPPIGMNENLSWWRAQKNGVVTFFFILNDVIYVRTYAQY